MDPQLLSVPRHAVAVIGGACSGAEAAETFADAGIHTVVFDMNPRPFGKIEDGLPRWHARQRQQEYERIGLKLKKPLVQFVPKTAIGRDITLDELQSWGFSAVVLACGAWRDRSLGVPGSDEALGRGVIYQNPFIYWFNHHEEKTYNGPCYEIVDGAVVVGGGLASIDVVKALMLETVAQKLRARGEHADVVEMEHMGLNKFLESKKLTLQDLGVLGCTLVYRRSVREMPIAAFKPDADEASKLKTMEIREKLMRLTLEKFLCKFRENVLPKEVVLEEGRVAGLRVAKTRTEGRKVVEIPDTEEVIPTRLIVASIGSIPEPIKGLPLKGEFYEFVDQEVGAMKDMPALFGVGNVVTGQGNIAISRKHSKRVSDQVVARYLGVGAEELDEAEGVFGAAEAAGQQAAERVMEKIRGQRRLRPEKLRDLAAKAEARQRAIGYEGDFDSWIAKVTPADLQ